MWTLTRICEFLLLRISDTPYYLKYKTPSNLRCNQFLNIGFRKYIRKVYISRIQEAPQFLTGKKCVKCASYIRSNTVHVENSLTLYNDHDSAALSQCSDGSILRSSGVATSCMLIQHVTTYLANRHKSRHIRTHNSVSNWIKADLKLTSRSNIKSNIMSFAKASREDLQRYLQST
jgi:hypothetical protein